KLLVNGSIAESKDAFLASFYERAGLPYVILLDADSSGRELAKDLTSNGVPAAKIINLDAVFKGGGRDFATEDILSADFYHQAVLAAYPANSVAQPGPNDKKRATVYEQIFKQTHNIRFNKRRVAESAKKLLADRREDKETRDNLGTLSTVIIE